MSVHLLARGPLRVTRAAEARVSPTMWAAALALSLLAAHLMASLLLTSGTFSYTLDDPYIHLALSEQIARGHYGLEPGVAAAPSSSIVWPFLLAPFSGTALHEFAPLVLNALAVAASAAGLFSFLTNFSACPTRLCFVLAVAATEVLYIAGLALTGMEHSFQVLLAVATVAGLATLARRGEVPRWLPLVLLLAQLVRYEGMAAAVFGAAVMWHRGQRRAAALTLAGSLTVVAAFSGFLMTLGLAPLPSSVLVKSAASLGPVEAVMRIGLQTLYSMIAKPALWLLFIVLAQRAVRHPASRDLYAFGAAVMLANMMLATGLERRYDIHLVITACMLIAYGWTLASTAWKRLAAAAVAVAAVQYGLMALQAPAASREIYLQQHQTSRFVADYLREPVAVNDLGLVSLRSDYQVLDLWGLGSAEAREARARNRPGWMRDLTKKHGVEVAMVYESDRWFGPAVPATWQRVARLRLDDDSLVAVGGRDVSFFATTPQARARLLTALADFSPTVPDGAALLLE